jgi:hypothetical protein
MADNHGNTPAAWAAVAVGLLGFLVGGIGLMVDVWPMFWVGIVLIPFALVVLGVMNAMGYGSETRH